MLIKIIRVILYNLGSVREPEKQVFLLKELSACDIIGQFYALHAINMIYRIYCTV